MGPYIDWSEGKSVTLKQNAYNGFSYEKGMSWLLPGPSSEKLEDFGVGKWGRRGDI